MKLSKVLQHTRYELIKGTLEEEITGITCNTEKIRGGELFVCLKGECIDGHCLVREAAEKGAKAIAVTRRTACPFEGFDPENISVVYLEGERQAISELAKGYYGKPYDEMITIGITGTKGKTSTSFMIKNILEKAGIKTGLIGTVHIDTGRTDGKVYESSLTTPEAIDIYEYFSEMTHNHCRAVVMEVSSQAIKLERVYGIPFDYAIFTNISSDHIGPREHRDFGEYLNCKSRLFRQCREGIFNGDDPEAEKIIGQSNCRITTFGFNENNTERIIKYSSVKRAGVLGTEFNGFFVPMPGKFTAYNAMAAAAVCRKIGRTDEEIESGLKSVTVPGRQECFTVTGKETIVIDYAHNGMSLKALIEAMKVYEPKRITVVFGCGGERDRNRRFEMGKAARAADKVIITNDNPRNEYPESIFSDIIKCLDNTEYTVIADRRMAISQAVTDCIPGEIAIIAGKGHENYQIIGDKRVHLSDREEVLKCIEKVKYEKVYI
ncbi:MAG: UDP-N-acetylmuramoyl-L-alanyl-D-glutamate--2,6-diaminopimelate ligase [Eubacteriaceae bacterium]|nr:UDP-N-acetylmuramoyl-L-alanyl-D-glutamate--2,6-diaminopimelate ligase [Eubacteriaceae bacterium]